MKPSTSSLLQEIAVRVVRSPILILVFAAAAVPVRHDQPGLLVRDALVSLAHQMPEYPLLNLKGVSLSIKSISWV